MNRAHTICLLIVVVLCCTAVGYAQAAAPEFSTALTFTISPKQIAVPPSYSGTRLTLTSISPTSVVVGASEFTLSLTGTGFDSSSVVYWNSQPLQTTFVNSVKLTAVVPASLVAAYGQAQVVVSGVGNITGGGGVVTGGAFKLAFTTSPTSGTAGSPFSPQPVVTVQDANGVTVTTSTASVSLGIANNPSAGTLSGTTTVNAVNGVATFSGLSIDKVGNGYTLLASSTALQDAISGSFFITAGAAAKLTFTTNPSSSTVSTAFPTQPVVAVQDVNGNTVITDQTDAVTLTITPGTGTGGATLSCTTNALTVVNGVASFSGCSINTVGNNYQLHAASGTLTPADSAVFNITASGAVLPTLPQANVNTTVPDTSSYAVSTVCASGCTFTTLHDAVNAASCGTVIKLRAGQTFTEDDYVLPVKSCSETSWIVIRSDTADSNLPAAGTRITPSFASFLPKLTNSLAAGNIIRSNNGTHHYFFLGLEFVGASNGTNTMLGAGLDSVSSRFIVDRCYFHAFSNTVTADRGVILYAHDSAVVSSYIADIKELFGQGEAQAVLIPGTAAGPYLVANNYLEGSTENILFGGGGTGNNFDVTIRHNYITKPLRWFPSDPSYIGIHFAVKNSLDVKTCVRCLLEGNIIENSWEDGQIGYSVILTPRLSQNPGALDDDITIRNNIIRHAVGAVQVTGWDSDVAFQFVETHRVLIQNNLFDDISGPKWAPGDSAPFMLTHFLSTFDVNFTHNTLLGVSPVPYDHGFRLILATTETVGQVRAVYKDNIFLANLTSSSDGVAGGTGTDALNYVANGNPYTFLNNAEVVSPGSPYPPTTIFVADYPSVQFVNYNGGNGGDYHLQATSPLHNAASDGTDVGANINTVNTNTSCVLTGVSCL